MPLPKHSSGLHAFVSRGKNLGKLLHPHRHNDGTYVVSKTRFEDDYIRVTNESELMGWIRKGYSLRMSNPARGVKSPSLIVPSAIYQAVCP